MTRNKLHKTATALLLALVTLAFAGCNKDDAGSSGPSATPSAAKADLGEPSREIVIEANDQMKFNVESFTIAPGEVVKLTLNNVGTMPKFSMGHNVVILARGTHVDNFVNAAAGAPTTDYIPAAQQNKVIAATKLLGGGESDSVVFKAPTIRGDYVFLCSFPGHVQSGMKGMMKVQ